jgi:hypothetical protein
MRSLVVLLFLSSSALADPAASVEIWTRAPGRYDASQPPARLQLTKIDLDRLPLVEGELTDLQADGAHRVYRYVLVDELLRGIAAPPGLDLAILHFGNGMTIPLPFRDRAVMDRVHVAVARAVKLGGKWTYDLPEVRRHDELYPDNRPIRFHGNKIVVAEPWHPDLLPGTEGRFSPWRHADSLDGIELVSGDAYRAQFDVDPSARSSAGTSSSRSRFRSIARRT